MHTRHAELTAALATMLDKLENLLQAAGYQGPQIEMYLAGGMAVHYHCGTRYTEDVDASFSARLLLPFAELMVDYVKADGTAATLYFDTNYNDGFALMHPDYRERAMDWEGLGAKTGHIRLKVLTPLDLAVSKISRFSPQDQEDILTLSRHANITAAELRQHTSEALDYYVGGTQWIQGSVDLICAELPS